MGGLNYDRIEKRHVNYTEKTLTFSKDFPNCKGLYPDCPNEPSLMNSMCRTCPKTDGLKKPKLDED